MIDFKKEFAEKSTQAFVDSLTISMEALLEICNLYNKDAIENTNEIRILMEFNDKLVNTIKDYHRKLIKLEKERDKLKHALDRAHKFSKDIISGKVELESENFENAILKKDKQC